MIALGQVITDQTQDPVVPAPSTVKVSAIPATTPAISNYGDAGRLPPIQELSFGTDYPQPGPDPR